VGKQEPVDRTVRRDELTTPVATAADSHLEGERTRMGPRFVGDEFETPVYRVDGGVYYQTTFAYWRHRDRDLAVHPGQDIEHVVDDNEIHAGPCRPAHEEIGTYDATYYETQLVRAVESALSPLGRDRTDIHRELAETKEMAVTAFTSVGGK